MTRRDLVHRVAQLLARGRREEPATLRGAADVIARASEGDEVARLFVREAVAMAETSPHVVKLLDDAARTMAALKASLAQSESTGHEVRGARELPSVKTARDVQMALFVLGYRGPGGAPITFDGRPGPATTHALRHFQHVHKLPADGLPSPVILRELEWSLYTAGWDSEVFPARVSEVPTEATGASESPERRQLAKDADAVTYAAIPANVAAFQHSYNAWIMLRAPGVGSPGEPLRPLMVTGILDEPSSLALADVLEGLEMERGYLVGVPPVTSAGSAQATGYSDPGHAYGPRPPPLHVQHAPAPYYPESYAFPWHGRAYAEVPTSPRQLGDPLYASARTPWMGAQGYGAQYITRDQDETDLVPSPSYRWHWLERDEPEGERC